MSGLSGCPREKDSTGIFAVAAQHLFRPAGTTHGLHLEPVCLAFSHPMPFFMAAGQAYQPLSWLWLRWLVLPHFLRDAVTVGTSQAAGHPLRLSVI
jgi:hypothetical protein